MRISPIRPAAGQRELSCAIIYFFPMNCIIHTTKGRTEGGGLKRGGPAIQITKYNSICCTHNQIEALARVRPCTLSVAK